MATSKKHTSAVKNVRTARKKGPGALIWIAGAAAVVVAVAVFVVLAGGSKSPVAGGTAAATGGATAAASPSGGVPAGEQKYVGRYLPAGYTEPTVAGASTYSTTLQMSDVTPAQGKGQISVPASDVVSKKIVYFEYSKAGSDPIPLMAYVKPSGKLFVGVSFCPPCKGTRQTIEPDGTLRCAACGTKRDLETGAGVSGACRRYPIDEVPAAVSGGRILVQAGVLDSWTVQPPDRPVGA